MSVKVEVVESECIGCGACVATCPDVFEMEGDKAKPKKKELKEAGCAQDAADGCPVSCIKVTKLK
jgi:ferredoxin